MPGKFCPNCGAALADDAKFCTSCGNIMNSAPTPPPAAQQPKPTPPPVNNQQAYAAAPSQPAYSAPQQQYYNQTPPQQNYYNNANNRPDLTSPMKVGQYLLTMIVFAIPLVNIIMMFVWSFGSNVNINKKNYSRAVLIMGLIGGVISMLFGAAIMTAIVQIFQSAGGSSSVYYY